jgi:hypothetical protein
LKALGVVLTSEFLQVCEPHVRFGEMKEMIYNASIVHNSQESMLPVPAAAINPP